MKTRIKELREAKHLIHNALAIAVNCSQNYISQIELERTVPRADVLVAMAKFNTTVDYLLCLSEQRYKMEFTLTNSQQKSLIYTDKLHKLSNCERQIVYSLIDAITTLEEKE